jgi:hypothetical protein
MFSFGTCSALHHASNGGSADSMNLRIKIKQIKIQLEGPPSCSNPLET